MHKLAKGLKKKKKGKKSKHKEEELFKPEELEAYRREHQAALDEAAAVPGQNEEWKKFLALASGVDDVLKKTQGDLDRIKSTSFFQRVPPPSEVRKLEEEAQRKQALEAPPPEPEKPVHIGIVEVSESESEEDDEDDIFDTAYIDAIAAGDVKLAYIPESPTEEVSGEDPFDTSIAERAILGPISERKGKKLVPIGAAVEVLTGRVQIPTCATARPPSSRRQILKEQNLLLGSFDDNANSVQQSHQVVQEVQKTLLDDDAPLADVPIDLSKTLHHIPTPPKTPPVDQDDEEFALLAAESLTKPTVVTASVLTEDVHLEEAGDWASFPEEQREVIEDDPFDTAFAENILPGKAELKIIEHEILTTHFEEPKTKPINQIIKVKAQELKVIQPEHRDLLGGSSTDLSNLDHQPLRPAEQPDHNYIEYCDPFDTSIATAVPGHTELKFLEQELLGEDDFDPRAEEIPHERTFSRPDVLNLTANKAVSFDLPPTPNDLLGPTEESGRVSKPLTPFYARKSSVSESLQEEDPFDTSFVSSIAPGKAELKLIENELFDPVIESISDQDFDPRDESKAKLDQVVQSIKDISNNKSVVEEPAIDLLGVDHTSEVSGKVLTPASELHFGQLSYQDPFDTSIASNIVPGRTELKLLETELIHSSSVQSNTVDLLDDSNSVIVSRNPLNPVVSLESASEDVDPFDTSIANNIVPGKAELKLLESELI